MFLDKKSCARGRGKLKEVFLKVIYEMPVFIEFVDCFIVKIKVIQ